MPRAPPGHGTFYHHIQSIERGGGQHETESSRDFSVKPMFLAIGSHLGFAS